MKAKRYAQGIRLLALAIEMHEISPKKSVMDYFMQLVDPLCWTGAEIDQVMGQRPDAVIKLHYREIPSCLRNA